MTSEKIYSDNQELEKYNKKVTGATQNQYYCVFRVGKKFKNFNMIRQYQFHVNRESNVLNADPDKTKFNRILIGSENIEFDIRKYVSDVHYIRSNANLAFDLVLTAHHKFFEELTDSEKEKWINWNVEYLKNKFGDNCVSAILHQDETATHIHAVVVPKFYNEKRRRPELSYNKYIDGKQSLRDFQTDYADHMHKKFNNLHRGIRGSKARHMDIKTYYSILNKKLDIEDNKSIVAYAKYGYIAKDRMKILENTVMQLQEDSRHEKLLKRIENAEKETKEYNEVTKAIIKEFKLPRKDVEKVIDKVQENSKSKGRER